MRYILGYMATGYVPAMGGRHKGVLTGLALVCLAVNTCAAKAKPDGCGYFRTADNYIKIS